MKLTEIIMFMSIHILIHTTHHLGVSALRDTHYMATQSGEYKHNTNIAPNACPPQHYFCTFRVFRRAAHVPCRKLSIFLHNFSAQPQEENIQVEGKTECRTILSADIS